MKITHHDISIFKIIDFHEDITDKNVGEFEKIVCAQVRRPGQNFVFNFAEVGSICDKTIEVLRSLWSTLVSLNGTIICICPEQKIREKLILHGLDTIIPLYNSEKEFRNILTRVNATTKRLKVKEVGKYSIVDISNWFDNVTGYHELDDKMSELLNEGHKFLAINISGAQTIYSQMAGMLVHWSMHVKKLGGELVLLGVKDELKDQLLLMNFDKIVKFRESEKELS